MTVPAKLDLASLINGARWNHGIKLVVRGLMRGPVVNGSVTPQAVWGVEIFEQRGRKPITTLVAETPADLFRQLADFYEAGELAMKRS